MTRIHVIDSHTAGEPTRVVIDDAPNLGTGSISERRSIFARDFDSYRSSIINEPRGSDVLVGALLCTPSDPTCDLGVFFFNNVGTINMCVHGTIGVIETLRHLRRIQSGTLRIETPVGVVTASLDEDAEVVVQNVPSYRSRQNVEVEVQGFGRFRGDIAWGGNWFFLIHEHEETLNLRNVERLTQVTWAIRQALNEQRITGEHDMEIDHIELFGPPQSGGDSRNFVLCPGKAFDRSPCGTGTSAKLACLIADGKLKPEEHWRQESIIGSIFEAWGTIEKDRVLPFIKGRAYITAESTLIFNGDDPFRQGIRS